MRMHLPVLITIFASSKDRDGLLSNPTDYQAPPPLLVQLSFSEISGQSNTSDIVVRA